jgi:hypothetical protein
VSQPSVKVLYIAGSGRSGSTLLDNILGQVDGFFSAGEIHYLWERGLIENRLCGCGRRFRDCPLWQSVLKRAFGGTDAVDAAEIVRLQTGGTRFRHVPLMLLAQRRGVLPGSTSRAYVNTLARVYAAIRSVTGCSVIVDSSKLPSYGFVLGKTPGIDLYVAQLVRDPRATAYSWKRRKVQPDRGTFGYMHRKGLLKSAALWSAWNATSEALWRRAGGRYIWLRYEDFIARPRETVRRIVELTGEGASRLPFVAEHEVWLDTNHTVAGNPVRLKTGAVTLRADSEWRSRMTPVDQAFITALTWPLLLRYGYPTHAPRDGGWEGPAPAP